MPTVRVPVWRHPLALSLYLLFVSHFQWLGRFITLWLSVGGFALAGLIAVRCLYRSLDHRDDPAAFARELLLLCMAGFLMALQSVTLITRALGL